MDPLIWKALGLRPPYEDYEDGPSADMTQNQVHSKSGANSNSVPTVSATTIIPHGEPSGM